MPNLVIMRVHYPYLVPEAAVNPYSVAAVRELSGFFRGSRNMPVHTKLLRNKIPFSRLSESSLRAVCQTVSLADYGKDDVIVDYDEDSDLIPYLVIGSVTRTALDGRETVIENLSDSAQLGLINTRPSRFRLTAAKSNTIVFWVRSALVERAKQQQADKGLVVEFE